jgi:class 3 adenylate cyclase
VPQLLPGEEQKIWLNWPGKTENVPTYAFADVVDGKIPPQDLTDKLILLGLVADGWDPVSSPLDATTAGVYSHLALIDNLLNDRYLRRPPNWLVLLALLAIGPTTSWLLGDRNLRSRLAIAFGLPAGWFILAALLFGFSYWWLPVAAPIGTAFLGAIALQLREQYEKQQLMSLFEKHVAPETARMIWERKGEIFRDGELEPQFVIATVLFMDIRSFTSISETMTPRELLGWLNDYLEAMTDCIMDRGGAIDKYIGDAIMACFGVPLPRSKKSDVKEDAINAVAACIDMHRRLEQLNQKLKDQGKALIRFGIGLHTGPLLAGSVGGHRRVNYSVIGDTVNTASRLESMNKQLTADRDYQILVTEETFALVSDRYLGQQVDAIQLRGQTKKTVIYNILGEKSQEIKANVTKY